MSGLAISWRLWRIIFSTAIGEIYLADTHLFVPSLHPTLTWWHLRHGLFGQPFTLANFL
jgi:hypothetical protein